MLEGDNRTEGHEGTCSSLLPSVLGIACRALPRAAAWFQSPDFSMFLEPTSEWNKISLIGLPLPFQHVVECEEVRGTRGA